MGYSHQTQDTVQMCECVCFQGNCMLLCPTVVGSYLSGSETFRQARPMKASDLQPESMVNDLCWKNDKTIFSQTNVGTVSKSSSGKLLLEVEWSTSGLCWALGCHVELKWTDRNWAGSFSDTKEQQYLEHHLSTRATRQWPKSLVTNPRTAWQ